jgi:hypothetical protein
LIWNKTAFIVNLHYCYLPTKYHSGDQIKKHEMGRACSMCEREERFIQGFSGASEGNRPLGRPGGRSEDNINMNVQEV